MRNRPPIGTIVAAIVPAVVVILLLPSVQAARVFPTATPQASRTPPPPGGAFYPPYRPIGPPPFCDRANPPPPGGAFIAGRALGEPRRSGRPSASNTTRSNPAPTVSSPAEAAAADAERRFRSAFSMLRNYANARPAVCREVRTRAEAILLEFGDIMSAEQILEVGSCAVRCESPEIARTAFDLVLERFPDTSHATLAEAQRRRLPRR